MKAVRVLLETVKELFEFMWKRRLWWLIPAVAVMLLLAILTIFGGSTPLAPFIYTLF